MLHPWRSLQLMTAQQALQPLQPSSGGGSCSNCHDGACSCFNPGDRPCRCDGPCGCSSPYARCWGCSKPCDEPCSCFCPHDGPCGRDRPCPGPCERTCGAATEPSVPLSGARVHKTRKRLRKSAHLVRKSTLAKMGTGEEDENEAEPSQEICGKQFRERQGPALPPQCGSTVALRRCERSQE